MPSAWRAPPARWPHPSPAAWLTVAGRNWSRVSAHALAMVSFAAMALAPLMTPRAQLCLLVVCAIGFDLGVQVTLIAHQTIVYGIDPGARSRLNAVLFVGMFIGMAAGAASGSLLLAQWGWIAVTALATTMALAALGTRVWPTTPNDLIARKLGKLVNRLSVATLRLNAGTPARQ